MLSNTAVRSASLQGFQQEVLAVFPYSHIPGNNLGGCHDAGGGSDCGECVGRQTSRSATRSIENTSTFRKIGSGRMAQPKRTKRKRLSIGLNRWRGV